MFLAGLERRALCGMLQPNETVIEENCSCQLFRSSGVFEGKRTFRVYGRQAFKLIRDNVQRSVKDTLFYVSFVITV